MTEDGAPRRRIAWGHLALVTALASGVLAYLIEARTVSLSPHNLLLLQPTALLVLVLWAVIAWGCIRSTDPAADAPPVAWPDEARVIALVAAFGLFIVGAEHVGYDLAAWGFVLAALLIAGERNRLMLILFPPAFAAAVMLGFKALIPYPLATALV